MFIRWREVLLLLTFTVFRTMETMFVKYFPCEVEEKNNPIAGKDGIEG